MTQYTVDLCDYAANTKLSDFSPDAVEHTKKILLDGLGCAVIGSTLPWSGLLHDSMARFGPGNSQVFGFGKTLSGDRAALVNGSFIQGFELDDQHQHAGIHMCSVVVPAAMAAAELRGDVTGEEFLTAVLVGFEIGSRVGICMNPSALLENGWHGGSVIGPFPAAAAAGRIFGLSGEQMENAFGIAGTQASGLMAVQFGTMVKRMHHGHASQSGLYGAVLASDGYTGIARIFEQEYGGFCSTFVPGRFKLEELTADLGERFTLKGIGLKPFACMGGIHSTLDGLTAIGERRPVDPDDIEEIEVKMGQANFEHAGLPYGEPSTTSAQMCLPFCVAAFVIQGDVFIEQFADENIRNPQIIEFSRKVKPVHEPSFDALGTSLRHHVEINVRFRDGHVETQVEDYGRGSSMRPLTNEQAADKFTRLMERSGKGDRAESVAKSIYDLEHVGSIGKLLEDVAG